MPRTINLVCVIDDGTPAASSSAAQPNPPVQVAFGETVTLHVIVKTPSGRILTSSTARTLSYGARDRPIPGGMLLFQHLGTPTSDGGWDCPVVPADYKLIYGGSGRFFFDAWLVDTTSTTTLNPVQPLAPFIVTPSAIDPQGLATVPAPIPLTVFNLPAPGVSGTALVSHGASAAPVWAAPSASSATTLQGAYSAGGAGPQIIQFDVLRAGIELRDTGLGSGNPILTIADSTAFIFYQFTSNGLTVNTLASFNSGALVGGSGLFPTSDGSSALGDASNRFFAVAGISYLSGFSPMVFQSEALTSGTNPIFKWTADGDVAANLTGPVYRFDIGSEPLGFLDMLHASSGTVLLGYRAGTAITGLQFNSLGLIVTADFGGSVNSSHLLPGANAQQSLGLTNNRWLLVAAGISGEFSSSASPINVTTAKRSIGVSGAGARTVSLPAANATSRGFEIFVQDTGNSAGAISVTPNGTDTINGVNAAVSIAAAFGTRRLVCNGVDGWFTSGVF